MSERSCGRNSSIFWSMRHCKSSRASWGLRRGRCWIRRLDIGKCLGQWREPGTGSTLCLLLDNWILLFLYGGAAGKGAKMRGLSIVEVCVCILAFMFVICVDMCLQMHAYYMMWYCVLACILYGNVCSVYEYGT